MTESIQVRVVKPLGVVIGFQRRGIPSLFELARQVGDRFIVPIPGFPLYVTSNPDDAKDILQTRSQMFIKGPTIAPLRVVLGKTILTTDGSEWLLRRRVAQPSFHKDEEARVLTEIIASTRIMARRWHAIRELGPTINLFEELKRNSLRISLATLLGLPVEGDLADEAVELLAATLPSMWDAAGRRLVRAEVLPAFIPTPRNIQFKKNYALVAALMRRILGHRRLSPLQGNDVLAQLMREQEKNQMSDDDIIREVFMYYIATYGANAGVLAWAVLFLLQKPEVAELVVRDVQAAVASPSAFSGLERAEHLTQALLETMRLMPPAYIAARQATQDTTIEEWPIARGTTVLVDIYSLHRNRSYWAEADVFNLDRFSLERMADMHRHAFLPFGAGPRQCIAKNFNLLEMKAVLMELLSKYEFCIDPAQPLPAPVFDLAVTPRSGLFVRVRERQTHTSQ